MGTLNFSTVNSGNCKELGAEDSNNDRCLLDGNGFIEDGGVKLKSVPVVNEFKVGIFVHRDVHATEKLSPQNSKACFYVFFFF